MCACGAAKASAKDVPPFRTPLRLGPAVSGAGLERHVGPCSQCLRAMRVETGSNSKIALRRGVGGEGPALGNESSSDLWMTLWYAVSKMHNPTVTFWGPPKVADLVGGSLHVWCHNFSVYKYFLMKIGAFEAHGARASNASIFIKKYL